RRTEAGRARSGRRRSPRRVALAHTEGRARGATHDGGVARRLRRRAARLGRRRSRRARRADRSLAKRPLEGSSGGDTGMTATATASKSGPRTGHYTIISADCHAGGSHEQYREFLDPKYRDDFDAWRGKYKNPYSDLRGNRRLRNWDDELRNGQLE